MTVTQTVAELDVQSPMELVAVLRSYGDSHSRLRAATLIESQAKHIELAEGLIVALENVIGGQMTLSVLRSDLLDMFTDFEKKKAALK